MQSLTQNFDPSSNERHTARASGIKLTVFFMSGLVSIITPTYNCGRFIEETIRSVIAQTYREWEMIIVDDCSTDDTHAIVEKWIKADPRIQYFCNEQNSGAAVTRNFALRQATGKWIAFLDSDDLWAPDKLQKQVAFMEDHNYDFSYHCYEEIDESSRPLGVHVGGLEKVGQLAMFSCCWPGCLTVMYRRETIGLVQIEDIRKNNDTALWLKVIRKAPCYLLPEELARYRRRANSITPKPLWQRIWAHYPLFHVAERMNPIEATFWTLLNVVGNGYKKMFYVQKDK